MLYKWETLALHGRRMRHLPVIVDSLPGRCPKQHATLKMVRWCVSASMARMSSDNNFSSPHLFSFIHLNRRAGLIKLQSGPQSFNYIELELFVFQFYPSTFYFLYFLSNLILILLILIYFAFNLFLIRFYFFI